MFVTLRNVVLYLQTENFSVKNHALNTQAGFTSLIKEVKETDFKNSGLIFHELEFISNKFRCTGIALLSKLGNRVSFPSIRLFKCILTFQSDDKNR